MIRTKRAYAPSADGDGLRVLVDRLWPRGVSRQELALDDWKKELAPSDDLRRWFGHDPDKWGGFRRRYRAELQAEDKTAAMRELAHAADGGAVTLVYAAKDEEHNNAAALKDFLENMAQD